MASYSTDTTGHPDTQIAQGVAHFDLPGNFVPESYAFVLMPNLTMSAFSSAIEALRVANQLTGKTLFRWKVLSETGDNIPCSNGIELGVQGDLDALEADDTILICSGTRPEHTSSRKVSDWVRMNWRRGRTVGGICTGAYTLARAGILQGSSFTLHWENQLPFRELYPDLEPTQQAFVFDGRIWTCAGGIAATDMMLHRIQTLFGPGLAKAVANMCLVQVPRSEVDRQTASTAAIIGARNRTLINAIQYFEDNIDQEFNLDEVATHFGISRRQLERLFSRYLNVSPKQYLLDMRLQRARAMMAETNLSVGEVSAACGFGSPTNFSKRFRDRFGVSPHTFSISTRT